MPRCHSRCTSLREPRRGRSDRDRPIRPDLRLAVLDVGSRISGSRRTVHDQLDASMGRALASDCPIPRKHLQHAQSERLRTRPRRRSARGVVRDRTRLRPTRAPVEPPRRLRRPAQLVVGERNDRTVGAVLIRLGGCSDGRWVPRSCSCYRADRVMPAGSRDGQRRQTAASAAGHLHAPAHRLSLHGVDQHVFLACPVRDHCIPPRFVACAPTGRDLRCLEPHPCARDGVSGERLLRARCRVTIPIGDRLSIRRVGCVRDPLHS